MYFNLKMNSVSLSLYRFFISYRSIYRVLQKLITNIHYNLIRFGFAGGFSTFFRQPKRINLTRPVKVIAAWENGSVYIQHELHLSYTTTVYLLNGQGLISIQNWTNTVALGECGKELETPVENLYKTNGSKQLNRDKPNRAKSIPSKIKIKGAWN